MNLVKAGLVGGPRGLSLQLKSGAGAPVQIEVPTQVVTPALAAYAGHDIIAGIRPEAATLAAESRVTGPTERFVDAQVQVIEPTGADTLVVVDFNGQEFTARLAPDAALVPNQNARLLVDLSKLVCFDVDTERLIA
jgi:multiple sugar transport system ATP-binding protein